MSIPIPHRPSGFLKGDPTAQVTLDVFVDIQCPHSAKLWPTLMSVMDHYRDKSLSLKTHLITISNHRQAWDVSLGLLALADGDADTFYGFASYLYQRQELYFNGVFFNKTPYDLQQLIADFASDYADVDRDDFIEKMGSNDIYVQGRTPIRYAATRSVWGTPTIFINNANKVPVDHHSTFADWKAVLDPLLQE